ncbi:ABC transporter ATP-binding protein [Saccharopolyspora sp. 5N708]|uniref:ABC transporter ATP-binding protein n=1 Tax=Saccharopolyspora sp. 5N708 TaxID=3457424 RepID=UPI003FD2369D
MSDAVRVSGLTKTFPGRRGAARVVAVQDVSFSVRKGEALGLVGESGSGKTTVARVLVGLTRPDAGTIAINGRSRERKERGRSARLRRAKEVQMVFQDPYGSLDRRLSVEAALRDVLRRHLPDPAKETVRARIAELMDCVGLSEQHLGSRPHQLSGGQRQRVAIAKTLAVDPAVLVLDEAVSALDVSVQAQILRLLNEIRVDTGVSLVFVTHDLAVVGEVTSEILVMYKGEAVEQGATADVLRRPQHPYTEMLLSSAPGPNWKPERVAELRAAFASTR